MYFTGMYTCDFSLFSFSSPGLEPIEFRSMSIFMRAAEFGNIGCKNNGFLLMTHAYYKFPIILHFPIVKTSHYALLMAFNLF